MNLPPPISCPVLAWESQGLKPRPRQRPKQSNTACTSAMNKTAMNKTAGPSSCNSTVRRPKADTQQSRHLPMHLRSRETNVSHGAQPLLCWVRPGGSSLAGPGLATSFWPDQISLNKKVFPSRLIILKMFAQYCRSP